MVLAPFVLDMAMRDRMAARRVFVRVENSGEIAPRPSLCPLARVAMRMFREYFHLPSTPFYNLYRLTRHPVAGGLFALSFFAR